MPVCEEEEIDYTACGCKVADSSCINVSGSGSVANPFVLAPNIDPDLRNILTCSNDGLFAEMQSQYIWPTMRKSRTEEVPLLHGDPIPFSTIDYDRYLMSTIDEVAQIPFDGKWRVTAWCRLKLGGIEGSPFAELELQVAHPNATYIPSSSERDVSKEDPDGRRTRMTHVDEQEFATGDRLRYVIKFLDEGADEEEEDVDDAGLFVIIRSAFMAVTLVSL